MRRRKGSLRARIQRCSAERSQKDRPKVPMTPSNVNARGDLHISIIPFHPDIAPGAVDAASLSFGGDAGSEFDLTESSSCGAAGTP